MRWSFQPFLQKVKHEQSGFALPVAMLLLTVVTVMVSAVLYIVTSTSERVFRAMDTVRAADIAHAGFSNELALVRYGQVANLNQVGFDGGFFTVTQSVGKEPNTLNIHVLGMTTYGGRSSIYAVVQSPSGAVVSWRQSP